MTVPNRPLLPGLISDSETGAFARILVIVPSGPLLPGLLVLFQLMQLTAFLRLCPTVRRFRDNLGFWNSSI